MLRWPRTRPHLQGRPSGRALGRPGHPPRRPAPVVRCRRGGRRLGIAGGHQNAHAHEGNRRAHRGHRGSGVGRTALPREENGRPMASLLDQLAHAIADPDRVGPAKEVMGAAPSGGPIRPRSSIDDPVVCSGFGIRQRTPAVAVFRFADPRCTGPYSTTIPKFGSGVREVVDLRGPADEEQGVARPVGCWPRCSSSCTRTPATGPAGGSVSDADRAAVSRPSWRKNPADDHVPGDGLVAYPSPARRELR